LEGDGRLTSIAVNPALAVYSPLPPQRSGVADYVADQIVALARRRQVVAVVADRRSVRWANDRGIEAAVHTDFEADPQRQLLPRLYHLGNNLEHEFVYQAAVRTPGVVVLHDFVLHHLAAAMTLGRGDDSGYEALMRSEFGAEGSLLAEQRGRGLFTDDEQFLLPLSGAILDRARAVVVHSQSVRARIRVERPNVCVHRSQLHVGRLAENYVVDSRAAARRRLGVSPDVFLFASMGFITRAKQIGTCLRVLAELRHRLGKFLYVLAGQRMPGYDVDAEIAALGLQGVVRVTDYIDLPTFLDYLQASDLVFNLRWPSAGENSGTLQQALRMGRATIAYDYGPFADYPDAVCVKIPCQPDDPEALTDAVEQLVRNPTDRYRLERRAAEYAHCFEVDRCAENVLGFVERVVGPIRAAA